MLKCESKASRNEMRIISLKNDNESMKVLDSMERLYEFGSLSRDDYIGFRLDAGSFRGTKLG